MNQVSTLVVLKNGMPESCDTFFFPIVLEQWGVNEEQKEQCRRDDMPMSSSGQEKQYHLV